MNNNTTMQNDDNSKRKYVFVCGLQRSGTSLFGRNVARLEDCTGFKNTPVLEDEGQHLQDVYPPDEELGGTGRYGFNPRAHLTEASELLTAEKVARLHACWHSYWDKDKTICVEKTPRNLIMTRFLQRAFPNSYFIVLRRHPVAVSIATQKWKDSLVSKYRLFEHWLRCHELFEGDKKHLRNVYELTYENYIEDPHRYHKEIAAFIGTRVPEPPEDDTFRFVTHWRTPGGLRVPEGAMEKVNGAHNKKYFDQWSNLLRNSFWKGYYQYIARRFEPRFEKHGYSLIKGFGLETEKAFDKVSTALGPLFCLGADANAFIWRLSLGSREWLRINSKTVLPEFVVAKVRQRRAKAALSNDRARAVPSATDPHPSFENCAKTKENATRQR